jgi:hypothetical protein
MMIGLLLEAWVSIEGLRSTVTLAVQVGLEVVDGESSGKPRERRRELGMVERHRLGC